VQINFKQKCKLSNPWFTVINKTLRPIEVIATFYTQDKITSCLHLPYDKIRVVKITILSRFFFVVFTFFIFYLFL